MKFKKNIWELLFDTHIFLIACSVFFYFQLERGMIINKEYEEMNIMKLPWNGKEILFPFQATICNLLLEWATSGMEFSFNYFIPNEQKNTLEDGKSTKDDSIKHTSN